MKRNRFGQVHHPGQAYRNFQWASERISRAKAWRIAQNEFKRRKRLRKISRLMRKGKHPKRSMRPKP